jgi:hypothetical protein
MHARAQQVQAARDPHQKIIEVVGEAARQLAKSLHLLRLMQPLLLREPIFIARVCRHGLSRHSSIEPPFGSRIRA